MSKTLKKKKHWLSKVQECALTCAGDVCAVLEVRGRAEQGEFPTIGRLRDDPGTMLSGRALNSGDILLEVNGTAVSGLTNRDTLAVIRHFREPIRLKTVKPVMCTILCVICFICLLFEYEIVTLNWRS